jgi:hypothetical protein
MPDITVHNIEEVKDQEASLLLQSCVGRMTMYNRLKEGHVYCRERESSGWCEHIMRMQFEDGGALTVGALQRKPGEEFEFHS